VADSLTGVADRHREQLAPIYRCMLDADRAGLKGHWGERLRQYRQAERLAPKAGAIKYLVACNALAINHPQEAADALGRIADPDLVSDVVRDYGLMGGWGLSVLASAHHMLGNYQEELRIARIAREHYPDVLWRRAEEAGALSALGRIEEVRQVIDESCAISAEADTPWQVMLTAIEELRAHGHEGVAQEIGERAVEWCRNRYSAEPTTVENRARLADALYQVRQFEEAEILYTELAAENPDNIDYRGYLGVLAARKGNPGLATEISGELGRVDRPYLFGANTFWRARIASLLGDRDQTMELLRAAFAEGRSDWNDLHNNIDLEPVWDYPPFQELIRPKG